MMAVKAVYCDQHNNSNDCSNSFHKNASDLTERSRVDWCPAFDYI